MPECPPPKYRPQIATQSAALPNPDLFSRVVATSVAPSVSSSVALSDSRGDACASANACTGAVAWRGVACADLDAFASRVPSGWCDLEVTSNASFLRSASHPEELVARAASLGHGVAAISDFATLGGAVRAHTAALEHNMPLAVGSRVRLFFEPFDVHEVSGVGAAQESDSAEFGSVWQSAQTEALDRATDPRFRLSSSRACHAHAHAHGGRSIELLLFASDRASYAAICRLLTIGRRRSAKGLCLLALHDLFEVLRVDLGAVLRSARQSADAASAVTAAAGGLLVVLLPPTFPDASHFEIARALRALFGRDQISLGVRRLGDPDDRERSLVLASIARSLDIPLVALGDVRMHTPERLPLLDVLACIRGGVPLERAQWRLQQHAERALKDPRAVLARFEDRPQWLDRAGAIAQRASQFSLAQLRYEYPEEIVPAGVTPMQHLRALTWQGAEERYRSRGGISPRVRRQIEHEFSIVDDLQYAPFFLTVHDLVRFARSRGILCQGRGAAANSAVCFSLGITSVDPDRIDVLFERFVSRERNEPPDIDVDFEHERREEVMQYLYTKYGRHRAALAAEVITYRARSAVRDVGKAFGVAPELLARLGEAFGPWHTGSIEGARLREVGLDPSAPLWQRVTALASEILGFPRHRSQHVGGFVITRGAIDASVPVENAAMAGRTVIEWDKDDIEALGMLKVDVLALGMLTCIRKAIVLINHDREEESRGSYAAHPTRGAQVVEGTPATVESRTPLEPLEFHTVPAEDSRVYDMVCQADTVGVFQIESRAQMSMLPRLRPRCFYDLVIEVAIVRPGPIQGDMVHPYLRRRNGEEPIEYPSAAIEQVLGKTLGVPLFQEQAMALAVVAAGFTPGKADELRRAIASWKRRGNLIAQFGESLVGGMRERGYSEKFALQVFEQLKGFSGYGFPESHAASFALLVYVSAWIKRFHPAAFAASLLNSQPMGFYAPSQIVRDAEAHGVMVRRVDVHASDWDCSLERDLDFALDLARGRDSDRVFSSACSNTRLHVDGVAVSVASSSASLVVPRQCSRNTGEIYEDHEIDIRRPSFAFTTPAPSRRSMQDALVGACGNTGDDGGGGARRNGAHGQFEVDTQPALRLGLRLVRGLDAQEAQQLSVARATHRRFTSVQMLQDVSGLSAATLQKLAQADAFRSMGLDRQQALWQIMALRDRERPLWEMHSDAPSPSAGIDACTKVSSVASEDSSAASSTHLSSDTLVKRTGSRNPSSDPFADAAVESPVYRGSPQTAPPPMSEVSQAPCSPVAFVDDYEPALPRVSELAQVARDYSATGLSLKCHPISCIRVEIERLGCVPCARLADASQLPCGAPVGVAGLVTVRQRPQTAKGILFVTLEDETGIANLIVRKRVYERFRRVARMSVVLLARGTVERRHGVVHVLVGGLRDVGELLTSKA